MGTRIKVTYVAVDAEARKPIASAETFDNLRLALDEYYAVDRGEGRCLGWYPFDSKYPDDYEGHYEYEWKNIVRDEIYLQVDIIRVYCIDFYPETKYEV